MISFLCQIGKRARTCEPSAFDDEEEKHEPCPFHALGFYCGDRGEEELDMVEVLAKLAERVTERK